MSFSNHIALPDFQNSQDSIQAIHSNSSKVDIKCFEVAGLISDNSS